MEKTTHNVNICVVKRRKMLNKGLFTSDRDDWGTPQKLFDELNKEFHFTTDVCASGDNTKVCEFIDKEQDFLKQTFNKDDICFMNPPYGRVIGKFIEHAYNQSLNGAIFVCLLPARTDTRWFHDYIYGKAEIRFIKGRLKFEAGKIHDEYKYTKNNSAPFPSMIVIFST